MEIYFFFKKYYRAIGYQTALFLYKRGITANVVSIGSIFVILGIFLGIHTFIESGILYWIIIFLAINIKLILNAIDGIIAEQENVPTQLGKYLNVGSDIIPDIFIIYIILSHIGVKVEIISILCGSVFLYLCGEYLYIYLHKQQNLFYGKELRVIFFIIIYLIYIGGFNPVFLIYIYILFFLLHNVGFYSK